MRFQLGMELGIFKWNNQVKPDIADDISLLTPVFHCCFTRARHFMPPFIIIKLKPGMEPVFLTEITKWNQKILGHITWHFSINTSFHWCSKRARHPMSLIHNHTTSIWHRISAFKWNNQVKQEKNPETWQMTVDNSFVDCSHNSQVNMLVIALCVSYIIHCD